VPVKDAGNGHVLASLAIHAPTARANLNDLLATVPRLKETAQALAPLLQHGETLPGRGVREANAR
jgi:DNA-binding IclR family transcriptional regulator